MLTHYTDSEIKQKLKELVVICDTRENINGHLTSWLDQHHIQHKSRALETGDYSVMLGDTTFEDEVAFERKANLDESPVMEALRSRLAEYRERRRKT